MAEIVEVEAKVKRIIFQKENFAIVAFSSPNGEFTGKGTHDKVVAIGNFVRMYGTWTEYQGTPQLAWSSITEHVPPTPEAIQAYLHRMGHGIGPALARQIVQRYGAEGALKALKDDPGTVAAEIKGLSERVAQQVSEDLKGREQYESVRIDLINMFDGIPFRKTLINQCVLRFEIDAARRIKENPFVMIEKGFKGCGFKLVDQLWRKLKLPLDSPVRQGYALWYCLSQTNSVWLTVAECSSSMGRNLTGCSPNLGVAFKYANDAGLVVGRKTKRYGQLAALSTSSQAENTITANLLARLV